LGGPKTRASLPTADALASLCVSLLLLSTAIYAANSTAEDMIFTRAAYYQKVADQILLTSAMNGWINMVAEAVELEADPTDHLSRIACLCPDGYSCQILLSDRSGIPLKSMGGLRDTIYGEANYALVTSHQDARIVCRVSRG